MSTKFTIARDALLKPLQLIVGVVERRQTLPILSNVLLSLQGSELLLTATDLEVELVIKIKLEHSYPDYSITVPARKLADICRSLPDNSSLLLFLDEHKFNLSCGHSRFNLATRAAADFPKIDQQLNGFNFTLPIVALRKLFTNTAFAMAQQDVRYFLNGTLLSVSEQTLIAVATDGHRLALAKQRLLDSVDKNTNIIVPKKGVVEIQRLLSDQTDENVELTLSTNHIRVKTGSFILTSKLIAGRYPDYQKVIPKLQDNLLLVDRDVFKSALLRVAVLSNDKIRGVRLELSSGRLRLSANNLEQERAEDKIEVNYHGEAMEISININYLLDVLNVLSAGMLKMYLTGVNGSILIEQPEHHSGCVYVVMPMRL